MSRHLYWQRHFKPTVSAFSSYLSGSHWMGRTWVHIFLCHGYRTPFKRLHLYVSYTIYFTPSALSIFAIMVYMCMHVISCISSPYLEVEKISCKSHQCGYRLQMIYTYGYTLDIRQLENMRSDWCRFITRHARNNLRNQNRVLFSLHNISW